MNAPRMASPKNSSRSLLSCRASRSGSATQSGRTERWVRARRNSIGSAKWSPSRASSSRSAAGSGTPNGRFAGAASAVSAVDAAVTADSVEVVAESVIALVGRRAGRKGRQRARTAQSPFALCRPSLLPTRDSRLATPLRGLGGEREWEVDPRVRGEGGEAGPVDGDGVGVVHRRDGLGVRGGQLVADEELDQGVGEAVLLRVAVVEHQRLAAPVGRVGAEQPGVERLGQAVGPVGFPADGGALVGLDVVARLAGGGIEVDGTLFIPHDVALDDMVQQPPHLIGHEVSPLPTPRNLAPREAFPRGGLYARGWRSLRRFCPLTVPVRACGW